MALCKHACWGYAAGRPGLEPIDDSPGRFGKKAFGGCVGHCVGPHFEDLMGFVNSGGGSVLLHFPTFGGKAAASVSAAERIMP